MTSHVIVKKALKPLMAQLKQYGFVEIKTRYFFMARQRGPFVDTLEVWTTGAGFLRPMARVWALCLPEIKGLYGEVLDVETCSPKVGDEFSNKKVRDSYVWLEDESSNEASIDEAFALAQAKDYDRFIPVLEKGILQVAVPWFDSINSGDVLLSECKLDAMLWRTVRKVDRESMAERTDRMLRGDDPVLTLTLLCRREAEQFKPPEPPAPARAKDSYDDYETVYLPVPEQYKDVIVSIETLRKKKKPKPESESIAPSPPATDQSQCLVRTPKSYQVMASNNKTPADAPPPDAKDWGQMDPHDLDLQYAYKRFFSKTREQIEREFNTLSKLEWSDEIRWMPPIPFRYYLQGFAAYVARTHAQDSWEAADAASSLLNTVEHKLRKEPDVIRAIMESDILPVVQHIATHQDAYGAPEHIYGSFAQRAGVIEQLYAVSRHPKKLQQLIEALDRAALENK